MPWIFTTIAPFSHIFVIGQITRGRPFVRMKTIVTLVGLKPTLRDMNTNSGVSINAEPVHGFPVQLHMCLANQNGSHAKFTQIITQRQFINTQRHIVPDGTG